jgi:hypothetical protein
MYTREVYLFTERFGGMHQARVLQLLIVFTTQGTDSKNGSSTNNRREEKNEETYDRSHRSRIILVIGCDILNEE